MHIFIPIPAFMQKRDRFSLKVKRSLFFQTIEFLDIPNKIKYFKFRKAQLIS